MTKRTSLHQKHRDLGARMISFAGFEMPLSYSSIIEEHLAVRRGVGIFDLSHMGEFEISGRGAEAFLQKMTVNDVSAVSPGQAQYTAMCLENGGIIDDLVFYSLEDRYLLVVNASNTEKDFQWLRRHLPDNVRLENVSDGTTLIAVQGPASRELLSRLVQSVEVLGTLPFYHHTAVFMDGKEILCARTGYTGELGYELYIRGEGADSVWDRILAEGDSYGLKPVGLGARDTLRLEMKYCLYGNDIDETTHPLEAGLGWITKLGKKDFIGQNAILKARMEGISRKLVGVQIVERGIPRRGYEISVDEKKVGAITSGCYSPSLGLGIGMGYVGIDNAVAGTILDLNLRGKLVSAKVVKTPFWEKGTATMV